MPRATFFLIAASYRALNFISKMYTKYWTTRVKALVIIILLEDSWMVITTRYMMKKMVSRVMTHQSMRVPYSARK